MLARGQLRCVRQPENFPVASRCLLTIPVPLWAPMSGSGRYNWSVLSERHTRWRIRSIAQISQQIPSDERSAMVMLPSPSAEIDMLTVEALDEGPDTNEVEGCAAESAKIWSDP